MSHVFFATMKWEETVNVAVTKYCVIKSFLLNN